MGFPFLIMGSEKFSSPLPAFSISQRKNTCTHACLWEYVFECLLFSTACKYCSCLKWKIKVEIVSLQIYCIKKYSIDSEYNTEEINFVFILPSVHLCQKLKYIILSTSWDSLKMYLNSEIIISSWNFGLCTCDSVYSKSVLHIKRGYISHLGDTL